MPVQLQSIVRRVWLLLETHINDRSTVFFETFMPKSIAINYAVCVRARARALYDF